MESQVAVDLKGLNILILLRIVVLKWVHRGHSDTAANANSGAPQKLVEGLATKSQEKATKEALQINSLASANSFLNEVLAAEIPYEWVFAATKSASDCECDGLVRSGPEICVSI